MPKQFSRKPKLAKKPELNLQLSRNLTRSVIARSKTNALRSVPLIRNGLKSRNPLVRKFFRNFSLAAEKGILLKEFERPLREKKYSGPYYGDWILHLLSPYFKEAKSWKGTPEEYFQHVQKELKDDFLTLPRHELGFLARLMPEYSKKLSGELSNFLKKEN